MAVAASVGAAFSAVAGKAPRLIYPDQIFGWQPFLSLVHALYVAELPALFVYTGRFPEIHLAAVWP